MRRRDFITLFGGGAAAWPLAARAQQVDRIRRIGVLMAVAESDAAVQKGIAIFQQRLKELGWKDGHNIRIDYRWGGGDPERIQTLAKELFDLQPDVLIGHSTPSAKGLLQQTRAIPIIFLTVTDPLGQGLVASLSHPGGNITGFSVFEFSLGSKWLETLKQIAPGIRRVTAIFNPETAPYYGLYLQSISAAAPALAVETIAAPVHSEADIENVIRKVASDTDNGLFVLPDSHNGSIVKGSSSSPQNFVFRQSTISAISFPTVVFSPMARMKWISSNALRAMWIEFSKVRVLRISQSSNRPNSSW
jgi:putative ABC transport system substrate-binding protein